MKLSHAVFVYPRIELPFLNEWLNHHEKLGVDHVYMTLHLNIPLDQVPTEKRMKWRKKLGAPYIVEGTELELVENLKNSIKGHIDRDRITINFAERNVEYSEDHSGDHHCPAQCESYEWAKKKIIERSDPQWDWLLVCDVDEFFVPENPNKSIKDVILEEKDPNVSSLRCCCVNHPTRHDYPLGELPWNTYTQHVGIKLSSSKYACSARRTKSFSIHWSYPDEGSITRFSPPMNVHHFCGFNKNSIVDNLIHAWPPENRLYSTKESNSPYILKKDFCERPRRGPHNPTV